MKGGSRVPIVGGVVALVFLAAALVFGLGITGGVDESTTPFISTILAMIGATIPAIFALNSADKARQVAEQTNTDVRNGVLKNKVKEALTEHANESDVNSNG
jgi:hypothetical protein